MAAGGSSEARRTSRQRKPSLKALESLYISKLKNSGFVQVNSSDEGESPYFTDDEDYEMEDTDKPKLLHDKDVVYGEEIFKFQKRKQSNALAQKVTEACSLKTPCAVRRKTKTRIEKIIEEDSESEYEASSSPSQSSCTSEENETDSEEEQSGSKENQQNKSNKVILMESKLPPSKAKSKGKYTIKTDEYFASSLNKMRTSNNTLDKLETPRLPQYQLQKLLQNMKLSDEHENALKHLSDSTKNFFQKWLYFLNENFNILLYGLGSKRNILNSFHMEYLKDLPVIVVNGFFPTLSIKNILDAIIIDLLESKQNPGNLNEACDLIVQEFRIMPDTHLYIIIHNIEGETIRNGKSQNILARLAAVKNIHLIVSMDHINGPLIWDHEETSFERSMMIQQTGALALSSLRNVFMSLTTNSKSIYIMIAKYQLENSKNQYYQGLAFKDLYMSCREAFIVSSDLALRAQLSEFVDHKMVKLKRSVDGTEYLVIPLSNSVLQKFLEENS